MSDYCLDENVDESEPRGEFFYCLRKCVFSSPTDAARHLNVDSSSISRYESGDRGSRFDAVGGYIARLVELIGRDEPETFQKELIRRVNDRITRFYGRKYRFIDWNHVRTVAEDYQEERRERRKKEHNHFHNLPDETTSFIGREKQIKEICELLEMPTVRLVTLAGPPGVGKTRLGIKVAKTLLQRFRDGVGFISMSRFHERDTPTQELIAVTIAQALNQIIEGAKRPPTAALKDYLRDKAILLVLDNFEYVLSNFEEEAEAVKKAIDLLLELLRVAPELRILITSRAPLDIKGEQKYPVPSMDMPELEKHPSFSTLSQSEALVLFNDRAKDKMSEFKLDSDNVSIVAKICKQLDCLPLAIQLAAAHIKDYWPSGLPKMLEELQRQQEAQEILAAVPQDEGPDRRHVTMRTAIAWSYERLTVDQQRLLRWLAVFARGWTIEVATTVCAEADAELNPQRPLQINIDKGIQVLEAQNLLEQREGRIGEPRFIMLETIRAFGQERLEKMKEINTLQGIHCEYFLKVAEAADKSFHGLTQEYWLDRLDAEHENLLAALRWVHDRDVEKGLRLYKALGLSLWEANNYFIEGEEQLKYFVGHKERIAETYKELWAQALGVAGKLAYRGRNLKRAYNLFAESKKIGDELNNDQITANALLGMGFSQQKGLLRDALELFEKIGDRWGIGYTYYHMGIFNFFADNLRQAQQELTEALKIAKDTDDPWSISHARYHLGMVGVRRYSSQQLEQWDMEVKQHFREARSKVPKKDKWLKSHSTLGLSLSFAVLGKTRDALDRLIDSQLLYHDMDEKGSEADCLFVGAIIAIKQDQLEKAAWLLGAYERHSAAYGYRFLDPGFRFAYSRHKEDVQKELQKQMNDDEAFNRAYQDGNNQGNLAAALDLIIRI